MCIKKLLAVLKLTRIEHSLMLVIAVVAAELLANKGSLPAPGALAFSLLSPIFISMASFAINDYFDVEVDRLNRKKGPLVTGALTKADAIYVTAISLVVGIAAGAMINAYAFAIALVFAVLSVLYSYRLKEMLLIGNVYIALSMVIPFIFGNYVVGTSISSGMLLICAMTFASGLAREIHGTIRDYEGDVKARKARTIPKVIGIGASSFLALALYIIAVLVSAYLFLYTTPFKYNLVFGVIVALSDMMLLYVGVIYLSKNAKKNYGRGRNISLLAMGLATVAILLSPVAHI